MTTVIAIHISGDHMKSSIYDVNQFVRCGLGDSDLRAAFPSYKLIISLECFLDRIRDMGNGLDLQDFMIRIDDEHWLKFPF